MHAIIAMWFVLQMMIPRVSFFPLVYDKLDRLYSRAAGRQADDELWLSAEATPLKWCIADSGCHEWVYCNTVCALLGVVAGTTQWVSSMTCTEGL